MAVPWQRWLDEDLAHGDVTTVALGLHGPGTASVVTRQRGVIAGLEAVRPLWEEGGVAVRPLVDDGAEVEEGTVVLGLQGPLAVLHGRERTALNLLGRMSGIATATAAAVAAAREVRASVVVAATRKTAPGLRHFDKWAVVLGGGDCHRYDAGCGILIKDRHLSGLDLQGAVGRALHHRWTPPMDVPPWARTSFAYGRVEVEVRSAAAAAAAARAGAHVVLLDNLPVADAAQAAAAARDAERSVLVEVSGGLRPQTVAAYAAFADVLSLGWLTHSSPPLDLSQRYGGAPP